MGSPYRPAKVGATAIHAPKPGATLITSNLPFDEWTDVFGSERLTAPCSTG
jgi:hypothetical protein